MDADEYISCYCGCVKILDIFVRFACEVMSGGESEVAATAAAGEHVSRERSKLTDALLSRANTMLRAATLSREASKHQARSPIKATIATLERQKTVLAATAEDDDDDDEMHKFLLDIQKTKVKQFTDSDFDTDLEDEIGMLRSS